MPNQYTALTKENILRKVNRKKNPVRSLRQLADEFGYNTTYSRWSRSDSDAFTGQAAPPNFRRRVKNLVGTTVYNEIRDSRSVNSAYR